MKRALDLLGSLRLTIALLTGLLVLFLAGVAIPQRAILQPELYAGWRRGNPSLAAILEWLHLTDAYRSPVAIALWVVFFLNLTVVMARRVPATIERVRVDRPIPDPATASGFTVRRSVPAGPEALRRARAFFAEQGFHVRSSEDAFRAVRNRFAPAATLAFHWSFILVALGAVWSSYTRFEGLVELGPGETFTAELGQYARPPLLPSIGAPPRVRFTLEQVLPQAEGNVATELQLQIRDEEFRSHTFGINHPYEVGDVSFVFKQLGVAPLLLIHDASGAEVFGGWMRLGIATGERKPFRLLDWAWTAAFFPDYERDGEGERTRSLEPRNPALSLTIETQHGQRVERTLLPGETASFGPYTVTFADWRYWVTIYVRSERGIVAIWTGFGIGTVALVLRLLRSRREFIVRTGGTPGAATIEVAGRAEYFRVLFADEADALLDGLARSVRGAADGA